MITPTDLLFACLLSAALASGITLMVIMRRMP